MNNLPFALWPFFWIKKIVTKTNSKFFLLILWFFLRKTKIEEYFQNWLVIYWQYWKHNFTRIRLVLLSYIFLLSFTLWNAFMIMVQSISFNVMFMQFFAWSNVNSEFDWSINSCTRTFNRTNKDSSVRNAHIWTSKFHLRLPSHLQLSRH